MAISRRRGVLTGLALALAVCAVALSPAAAVAAPPDRTAPTVPKNPRVQTVSFTWLTLAWDASSDNSGTVMYDGKIDTPDHLIQDRTFDTSLSFGGLAAGTTYTASVRAVDIAGNASAWVSVQLTTLARTLPPPTTPTNLRGVYVNGTLDRIAWDPSTHSTPVSYVLYSGDTFLHSGSATSVSIFDLVFVDCAVRPGGTYTMTVQAWAADNYPSQRSAPLTVTIPRTVSRP
jgi:hypothetical protein